MKSGKTIETAQRALEIFKSLMQQNLSVDEILDCFSGTENYSVVYTKEAIYKYFNTFKYVGAKLKKEHGQYEIIHNFNACTLNEENILILNFIENYVNATQQPMLIKKFNKIKTLIQKNNIDLSSKIAALNIDNILKLNKKYEEHKALIAELDECCLTKQTVKITYNSNGESLEQKIVADKIVFEKGSLVLKAYCIDTFSILGFVIEHIENIKQLPQRASAKFFAKTVVFKLKDELALNYKLKKGEYIKEQGKNYLLVANTYQDGEELIKRLFRYGDKCEIMYPSFLRDDMKAHIEKTLNLYQM